MVSDDKAIVWIVALVLGFGTITGVVSLFAPEPTECAALTQLNEQGERG